MTLLPWGLPTTNGTKVNATPDSDPAKPVVDIFLTPQKLPKPKVEEVDIFEPIENATGPLALDSIENATAPFTC